MIQLANMESAMEHLQNINLRFHHDFYTWLQKMWICSYFCSVWFSLRWCVFRVVSLDKEEKKHRLIWIPVNICFLFPHFPFLPRCVWSVCWITDLNKQREENRQAGLLLLLLLMFAVGVELRSLISEGRRADKVRPSWGTSPNKMHPPQSPQVLKEN